jgi:hypothetical protein
MTTPAAPGAGAAPAGPASATPAPGGAADPAASQPPVAGTEAESTGDSGEPQAQDHGVGSGEAATEATSRPGQGSLRNEYLREAERLTVEGDAVGRERIVFLIGGGQRVRLRRLSRRQIDLIRDTFVPPDGFDEVRAGFEKNRAVILRGPAGCGKQAIAVRMLRELSLGELFQLDSSVDLAQLAQLMETGVKGRDRIEPGAGFLLNQPSNFAGLYGSVLQTLEEALDQADARLVLTIDSGASVPDQDLFDYVVTVTATPRYEQIVESHLRYRLSDHEAALLLSRTDLQEVIDSRLATDPSCKLAAALAEKIAEVSDASDDEETFGIEEIKTWDEQRGAESFDTWFARLGDTRTRVFAVALAVLNGLPYDAVARAARMLYSAFERPPYMVTASADDVQPEGLRPFRISRREWLEKLRARISDAEIRGVYGHSVTEVVEYRDPDYASKVIRWAWSDYEVQDTLLDWLGQLADDPSEQVSIFAGLALGRLATKSFDFLGRNVLGPWANGRAKGRREAVAYALRVVVAADPGLRGNVRTLVSGWYANEQRPFAQATAARAWGVAYGPIDRAEAFRQLDRLCETDDIRVATAVGDSIADLLETGSEGFACSVLVRLAESIHDTQRSATIQLIFLILAAGLIDREPGAAEGTAVPWPFLLRLMTRAPQARGAIVGLWRFVLNEALFHEEAERVMTWWAAAAEEHPAVRGAFLRLARQIAHGDKRSLMILRRYCSVWSYRGNLSPLPEVSAALQTVLTAEQETR